MDDPGYNNFGYSANAVEKNNERGRAPKKYKAALAQANNQPCRQNNYMG